MIFLNSLPWQRLRRMTAIAGTTLITTLTTAAIAPGAIARQALSETQEQPHPTLIGQQLVNDGLCASDLQTALDGIIKRPQFASADWGIVVYPLLSGRVVYAHNSEKFLIPASNVKLLTTAAAIRIIATNSPDGLWSFEADLNRINRDSNNAMADEVLRGIGGQTRVQEALEPLGVAPGSFIQADGSGLSRQNKAKASTFITLLKGMYETDDSRLFYNSLPVAGMNGTLRNRFKGTPVQGKVRAKTGTLNGVRALSGYLETDTSGTIIFSIVVNQSGQSGRVLLDAIDEMVLTMADLQACD